MAAGASAGICALPRLAHAQSQQEDFSATDPARGGRLAVDVLLNGNGPFRFVVDSAANASLIAEDVATRLGLEDAGEVAMHTLVAREIVRSVRPARFQTGALDIEGAQLALATRRGLNGADGLIGSDLLRGLRLVLSFRGGYSATIGRSRIPGGGILDIRKPTFKFRAVGQRRFGDLIMMDVRSNGVTGKAIVDTGSEITIVNRAMATVARARPTTLPNGRRFIDVRSPTGQTAQAEAMILRDVLFSGVALQEVPVLVGDFHVFDVWGFGDRPAMLLAVDILGLFDTVAIDMRRGELVFEI